MPWVWNDAEQKYDWQEPESPNPYWDPGGFGRALNRALTRPVGTWARDNPIAYLGGLVRPPRQSANPQGPVSSSGPLPNVPEINPDDYGIGSGGPNFVPFRPEEYAPPPARTPNPALAGRTQYLQDREARLGQMFDRYLAEARRDDLSDDPWWQRVGRIFGEIAAEPTLATAGVATARYFDSEAERRRQIQDQILQFGMAREDLGGETAEARFNEETGQWEATTGTERDQYNTGLANTQLRNQAGESNADRANQFSMATYAADQELARARYVDATDRLRSQLLAAAGAGNLEAYTALFDQLPEDMQRQMMDRGAMQGLAAIIGQSGSRAHRTMERLAGRRLPRPPRNARDDAMAMARWYAQNGVPLSHPEVRNAFPGFSTAGE